MIADYGRSATGVGGLGIQVGLDFYLPFNIGLTHASVSMAPAQARAAALRFVWHPHQG
jgi:hypothetical protein